MKFSEYRKEIETFVLDFYNFSNKLTEYKHTIISISNNIRIPATEIFSDYSTIREEYLKHPSNVANRKKLKKTLKEIREEIEKFCEKYDLNYREHMENFREDFFFEYFLAKKEVLFLKELIEKMGEEKNYSFQGLLIFSEKIDSYESKDEFLKDYILWCSKYLFETSFLIEVLLEKYDEK